MGQTSSSPIMPGQATTHGQAFTQTEYTRQVMDQLLNYMIKQLSIRDLLQMSKESECKKYVLFKANSIYQYFYELRIFPTKDTKGLLTFRKIDDLVNPKGEQDKERQSLCLIVAYFYTRIFQIYGALAITLIDDMNAMTSSGIMTLPSGSDARLLTPGYYAQQPYYGKGGVGADYLLAPAREERPRMESRDAKESLKNFEWIRPFLTSDYTSSLGFKTRFVGSSLNRGDVYLKIEDVLKDKDDRVISSYGVPPLQSYQSGTFFIGISGMSKYASLEVYTRIAPGEIKIKTNKLAFTNQYGENISTDQFEKTFYVERQQVDGKTTYIVKDRSNTDISLYLATYFSEITQYLKDAIKTHKNATHNSRIAPSSRRSEEGITSHLRVEKMIDDLTTRKPLGHCIARALQLLKSEPFKNEPGISQICSAAFADNKRMGVVKRGAPLSDSPGLFALANLFYDTIIIGSPNLTIGKGKVDGKSSSMEQYVAFMTTLSKQYTLDNKQLTSAEYEEKGLASITDKRDERACSGITADIPISLDTTKKVHAVVQSMFQDQVVHASKCFKIISMLFNITYDKTTKKPTLIKLSDNLISKGFPELERINREARELLVSYYTNCENKYWTGMEHVLDEQKAKKEAAEAKAKKEAQNVANKLKAEQEAIAAAARAKAQEAAAAQKMTAEAKLAEALKEQERLKRERDEREAARLEAYRTKKAEEQRQQLERSTAYQARMQTLAERRAQEQREKEQRDAAKKAELEALIRRREELNRVAQQKAEEAAAALREAKALQLQKKPTVVTNNHLQPQRGVRPSLFKPYTST